jgi:hypothetical protein
MGLCICSFSWFCLCLYICGFSLWQFILSVHLYLQFQTVPVHSVCACMFVPNFLLCKFILLLKFVPVSFVCTFMLVLLDKSDSFRALTVSILYC